MILSMTGYGSASQQMGDKQITVEIKAINSKLGDIRLKFPMRYNALEIKFRKLVQEKTHRGKLELVMTAQNDGADDDYEVNLPLFKSYYDSLTKTLDDLGAKDHSLAAGILKIYNVVRPNTADIPSQEEDQILSCVDRALESLQVFRAAEGEALMKDLELRCQAIGALIPQLKAFEDERVLALKSRLLKNFEAVQNEIEVDKNRFEQELVYYLEKYDMTEEKIRLRQHCNYFLEVLSNTQTIKGKSLAFISQEMGREINTIGSKANHHKIQHLVVQMKEELEKIKEQLANVV